MSFDAERLAAAVRRHGRVARVVVAGTRGSVPREAGTAMLVWAEGQEGTIGGGALEWEAVSRARRRLASEGAAPVADKMPLGPGLGQCCGGHVTLVTEVFGASELDAAPGAEPLRVIRVEGAAEMPLAVRRLLAAARREGVLPPPGLVDGWLVEPVAVPSRALWIWGAGHVGRALAAILAPLPSFAVTWVDTGPERFPTPLPEGVTAVPAADPVALAGHAPQEAGHLVLTYSHALDLALCDALLRRGFASCGLIGSATKWARFRARLAAMGHAAGAIDRIDCPIGDPALGKHPHAIAVGVAADLLGRAARAGAGSGCAAAPLSGPREEPASGTGEPASAPAGPGARGGQGRPPWQTG